MKPVSAHEKKIVEDMAYAMFVDAMRRLAMTKPQATQPMVNTVKRYRPKRKAR